VEAALGLPKLLHLAYEQLAAVVQNTRYYQHYSLDAIKII